MHWVYYFGRYFIRTVVFFFATWTIKGRGNIMTPGPFLVVSNHLHIADPPMIGASFPFKCVFMAKEELWHSSWSRFWVKNFGAFAVRRGVVNKEAIRLTEHWLKRGISVIMFPEGGRSKTASLQKALPGAALIALRMNVPILPVSIAGSENFNHLTRCFFHHPRVTVTFGQPFTLPQSNGRPTKAQRDEIINDIMRKIAALLPPEYRGVYGAEKTAGN